MATYVEIANLAAAEIGTQARVMDPDEDKVLARAVKAVWNVEREATLRDGVWNFAVKRASQSALDAAVGYPYSNVFGLPADFVRLVEVLSPEAREDYQLEGGRILANTAGPLYIRYVANITEAGLFDKAFAKALALRIAWSIGRKIAGSTFDQSGAERKYERAIAEAMSADALENPPIEQEESEWITARWGGDTLRDPLKMG